MARTGRQAQDPRGPCPELPLAIRLDGVGEQVRETHSLITSVVDVHVRTLSPIHASYCQQSSAGGIWNPSGGPVRHVN
jgi:hypothetical protein